MQKEPVFYAVYWRTVYTCTKPSCCTCEWWTEKADSWRCSYCKWRTEKEVRRLIPVYRFDGRWRWSFQHYGEYRQGTSYRRNHEHQKKESSDETANKTIWRNSKKDWRHGYTWKRGTKSRGEHLKMARRNERRWVKQMLHLEQYEDILTKDGTMFYDPWDWD